jgi:hypothetical protein
LVCSGYKVNEKKIGYILRQESYFVSSKIASILFAADTSMEGTIAHPLVQSLIRSATFLTKYRIVIPFFWSCMKEWMLVIMDTYLKHIYLIYTRYTSPVGLSSSEDRLNLNESIVKKLQRILKESAVPIGQENLEQNSSPSSWKVFYHDPDIPLASIQLGCNRTPRNLPGSVSKQEDSGIYIAYAIDCDYYDCPIYATEEDWVNIRRNIAYYVLNTHLPHMGHYN